MAEPPSPGRGAAPPEQELLGARTAPDAKGSRGSQPAAKKVKGAEERSLKGAKRVNGEGGGGGGSAKQPLPAVVPSYSGPGPWGFATLPSGPSAGTGGFAFSSPLSRKLLPPAVLLPPSASSSSSQPQHQHRHHRHRLALAAEAGGGGSAKPKRPKEKRDKERRKHGALPVVAAAGDGGGALKREENGEVKLLFPKVEKEQQCGIDGIDHSSLLAFITDTYASVAPASRKFVLVGRLEV
ncbi:hypothetical protein Nmel_005246 [Mimus melanotis]